LFCNAVLVGFQLHACKPPPAEIATLPTDETQHEKDWYNWLWNGVCGGKNSFIDE
jgi:hypothetical protein